MRARIRTSLPLAATLVAVAFLQAPPLRSQGADFVRANYAKRETYIPMRDGVRLFTAVYAPKDQSKTYPILLTRTPYNIAPYGPDEYRTSIGPSELFARDGYIVVYQDVRGRWMSEGVFDHMRPHKDTKSGQADIDESTDTYDTIEWLLKNVPNHNGRVGMWGISYPGFYTSAGMIDAHPALKAASPQAPVADWFSSDDWHHNGAFLLAHAFGWFSRNGWPFTQPSSVRPGTPIDLGTEDGYQFYLQLGPLRNANLRHFKREIPFWNDMMVHERKDDFWNARNLRPHLKNIKPAVMTVGGWFDAENLYGALETYRAVETQSPASSNILVMGPWVHGGWARESGETLGDVRFGSNTSAFYREAIERPFFQAYLKGNAAPGLPEAYVFETGKNAWHKMDAWPPRHLRARTLYFHDGGRLDVSSPAETAAFDEYVSDPKKPVPLTPGIAPGMAQRYMDDDQRHAARRPDVVVYQTEALPADLTIAGPITVDLRVSTTGTDQDFIVKVIDAYPDRVPDEKGNVNNTLGGYQQLVRGDVMRGKFRNSLARPEPFVPGQITPVKFTLPDVFHTFQRGHRLMVQVQSSWFPLIDINPGKFMNIYDATDADFQRTVQRIHRSRSAPSAITVLWMPGTGTIELSTTGQRSGR